MSKIVFCYIKMSIIELFNSKDINTRQPLLYRTNSTFLVNYTDISMLIDSSKSILLQTPSNDFVKVSNRLGVGIDPSSIYSLHILGDTCISGSIVSSGVIVSNNINKLTTDISLLFDYSDDLSLNYINLYENVNDLSINYYTFKNNTIYNISGIKTDISLVFKYNNDLSTILLDLSVNHYTLKNSFNDLSSHHYNLKREVNDLSASNAILQSRVNILTTDLISVSNELYNTFSNFIYSIKTGFWGTLEFIDNSFNNQEFIINDNQFRVEWLIEWPTTRTFRSNYYSLYTKYIILSNDRLYSLDSSLIIQVKSIHNNSFSTSSESETLFVTQPNIGISSTLQNNDSIKQITLNLANIDTINNGTISIYYNPLYKGFYGTLLLTNNNSIDLNYDYSYRTINDNSFQSSINLLTSNTNYSITISSEVRVYNNSSPLILNIGCDIGYDISIIALLAESVGLNILTNRIFGEDLVGYELNLLPFNNFLENKLIGLSFEVYKTGFFGTFALGNKTPDTMLDYSYNYISIRDSSINKTIQTISGIQVTTYSITNYSYNSGLQTLSGQSLIANDISSEDRLAYADTLINLGLVIYNGYDISIGALPSAIVGISNNSLTNYSKTFDTSNILYNYTIIPLSSYLVNGTIGLSFEMYRTGFFGTFALGNKTSGSRFDYSYNYISISGSNINSGLLTLSGQALIANSISGANRVAYADSVINLGLTIYNGYDISIGALPSAIIGISNNSLTNYSKTFDTSNILYNYNIIPLSSYLFGGNIGLSFEMYRTGFFGTFALGNKTPDSRLDYSYNYISISGSNINSGLLTLSGQALISNNISGANRLTYVDSSLNLSLTIYNGYDISVNALPSAIVGISNNSLTNYSKTFDTSNILYNYNIIPLSSYLFGGTIGLSFEMYRTGFFGTFALGNKTSGSRFDYSYNYISISGSNINSGLLTLSGQALISNSISSANRLVYADSSLHLGLVIYDGYDISIGALPSAIIGISNNSLTSSRQFNIANNILYNYNIIPLSSYLVNGNIGISFEMYRTGFFGTFALGNKTSDSRLDYSYNYISISGSNINSGLLTLSGQALISNSINSANRVAYADSVINLGLTIYDGYDISVSALPSAIVGISNNILTSSRQFNIANNILYNYNIIPLSSYLFGGTIGLSFEMYRTGFFGTFALENKTSGAIFDYSYNYISISGTNVNSGLLVLGTPQFINLIIQNNPPSNSFNYFGLNSTKFAKNTNTNNNGTFKAAIGSRINGGVYYWTGTTISNEFILLQSPITSYNIGEVVAIDNAGEYIVSGGYVSNTNAMFGGRIWSTTSPYNSSIINYPFSSEEDGFVSSVHISGNGQRVFVGSYLFNKIYAFSHSNLNLTQIGGVITVTGLVSQTSFTINGFASDNSGNFLITTAYLENGGAGYVILYRYNGSTWVQTHGFSGTTNNDRFGYSFDMNCGSGIVCCAGAPDASIPYVKIYKRNTITDNWTEDQILYGTNGSGFGTSVSFNESGSNLLVTTKNAEIFNYTKSNNSEQFTLTLTIPSQQPTSNVRGQWVSTNSSGNEVILVKSSSSAASAYYFTGNLNNQVLTINTISSANRLAYANSSLNLGLTIYNGYDISVGALPSAIVGISNNSLTNYSKTFDTSNILYNYNIIPLSSYLVNGNIGISFEMYITGFFGTFALGNKTSDSRFDYSYNYISISGSNVNSGLLTLSGQALTANSISSANRLTYADSSLNLGLVIYNGYDISVAALPSAIVGISNNILTNYSKTFDTSNILYNYNIIPLSSYLFGGTIGLSFEMYRTGFFGTFALGNKTSDSRLDYSYNYISISGSNINSGLLTLSGQALTANSISSANRLAYADSSLNLGLVIYNGYDISVAALPSAIIGISNNILTSSRQFNAANNILYNYNIIPLSSYLVNGNIGISFEMYRTGFFGQIIVNNNFDYTIDYSYNYLTLGGSTIFSPSISINNTSSNTRTISGELRLREASSQIAMNIRTSSSVLDISYSISDGTINNFVVTTSSPYKYLNFNILPNVNNLVNGTLTFNTILSGWTGNVEIVADNGSVDFSVKTDDAIIADYVSNSTQNSVAVSLATRSSYLYIHVIANINYSILAESFSQNIGGFTNVFANGRTWKRYQVLTYTGSVLNYNVSTSYDSYN